MRRHLHKIVLTLGIMGLLIQLVPYGRDHRNPTVLQEPAWDRPDTRELAVRACFDCHSNQVRWPWYSHLAPASWLVQHDVDDGRRHLNFSQWNMPQEEAHEASKEVADGEMPFWYYTLFHPRAKLSPTERRDLIAGLEATIGASPHHQAGDSDSDSDS